MISGMSEYGRWLKDNHHKILSPRIWAAPHLHGSMSEGVGNDCRKTGYQIDLDPVHSVIRLTVTAETVTLELAEDIYRHLSEVASSGGPYAAIFDFSAAKHTTISTDTVRGFARRRPSVPTGRKQVVVGKEGHMYGLARLFQICGENVGKEFEVVQTLEEAYKIVEARPEDFTQRL